MHNSATQHTALSFSHARPLFLASLVAAACCLCNTATPAMAATEFPGQLKSVTITDAAGTNTPPTAVIEYTNDGDTYTFDASKSTDPDGSIASYKWDFGDGTTANTVSATHQFTAAQNQITLTVSDNKGGVTISQTPLAISLYGPELVPNGTFTSGTKSGNFQYGGFGSPISNSMTDRNVTVKYDSSYDGFSLSILDAIAGDSYRLTYTYSGTTKLFLTPGSVKIDKYSNTNITDSSWLDFTALTTGKVTLYIGNGVAQTGTMNATVSLKKLTK